MNKSCFLLSTSSVWRGKLWNSKMQGHLQTRGHTVRGYLREDSMGYWGPCLWNKEDLDFSLDSASSEASVNHLTCQSLDLFLCEIGTTPPSRVLQKWCQRKDIWKHMVPNSTFEMALRPQQAQKHSPNRIQALPTLWFVSILIACCSHPPKTHHKVFLYFLQFCKKERKAKFYWKIMNSFQFTPISELDSSFVCQKFLAVVVRKIPAVKLPMFHILREVCTF